MKLMIFADVDGTIYGADKKVSSKNEEAIKDFMSKGHEFIICTGNPYFDKMHALSRQLQTRYSINSNGASIFDKQINQFIFTSVINKDLANKILKFATENQIGADWWDEEKIYVNQFVHGSALKALKKSCIPNDDYYLSDFIKNDIFKIEFWDAKEKIDQAEQYLKAMDLQVVRMTEHHIEITNKNVSKGEAIKTLLKHLKVSQDHVMGIGDSDNDFTMLKFLNHSFAMGNAPQAIHDVATYSTGHVNEDGLASAIDKFYEIVI